jgi:hypothetical protein
VERREERLILRLCSREQRLLAPLSAVFEEVGGVYLGFDQHRGDRYIPITLARLLLVQRELRLFLLWPDGEMDFADLVKEKDQYVGEISDPFGLFSLKLSGGNLEAWWEYDPYTQRSFIRERLQGDLREYASLWEDALFSSQG